MLTAYDDNTILNEGRMHKGKKLGEVPAHYLLFLREQTWMVDMFLKEYIDNKREALEAQAKQTDNR